MVPEKKLLELREMLENSQNPLFFYDNDVDGLCSFLLLRRALDRGRGIAIKSFPELKENYLQKIDELKPDAIIVLDKAEATKEFIEGVIERNLPIAWIDHHESKSAKMLKEKTLYVNSLPTAEPTTFISHSVFERKEDLWIAMIGCIGDCFMPPFAKSFEKSSPELFDSNVSALEALNTSEIGRMTRILNFGLMDSTTNVVNLVKFLFKAKGPYDLLEENNNTKQLHRKYSQLNDFFNKQLSKAEEELDKSKKYLIHTYSGETSMSSLIANRLFYKYPDKLIVVGFRKQEKLNVSIRGKEALKVTLKAIEGIDGATGGGHEVATGAMIPIDDWEKFKENIINLTKN